MNFYSENHCVLIVTDIFSQSSKSTNILFMYYLFADIYFIRSVYMKRNAWWKYKLKLAKDNIPVNSVLFNIADTATI